MTYSALFELLGFGLLVKLCEDYVAFAAEVEAPCARSAHAPSADERHARPSLVLVDALYLRLSL